MSIFRGQKLRNMSQSIVFMVSLLFLCMQIKAPMGTIKYNNCTIDNRTIRVFKSQIQYNSTIAVVQFVPFLKFESRLFAVKLPILWVLEPKNLIYLIFGRVKAFAR